MVDAVRVAALSLLLVACSVTDVGSPSGVFPCTTADECPDGQACVVGKCYAGDAPTVVIIPPEVAGTISTSGSVVRISVEMRENGTRVATVYPAGGDFTVTVSSLPLRLSGCA